MSILIFIKSFCINSFLCFNCFFTKCSNFSKSSNSSEHTLFKSTFINLVFTNLISDNIINTFEFLLENGDDFFNNVFITSESFEFTHEECTMGFKHSFSIKNSLFTVFTYLKSSFFSINSKNKIVLHLG